MPAYIRDRRPINVTDTERPSTEQVACGVRMLFVYTQAKVDKINKHRHRWSIPDHRCNNCIELTCSKDPCTTGSIQQLDTSGLISSNNALFHTYIGFGDSGCTVGTAHSTTPHA